MPLIVQIGKNVELNPERLVRLAANILALQGHTDIAITDGPGDGCRDIHSIDQDGVKHLTQSKFHQDAQRTVASRETGDLVLGMVRLGYTNGTFITNGKISPQGKREFLDNYPGLNMRFIDGDELHQIVTGDSILKAIWFDGVQIAAIPFEIVLPVVARDLNQDKSIQLYPEKADRLSPLIEQTLDDSSWEVNLRVRRGDSVGTERFEPYRAPRVKTISESWWPQLHPVEAIIRGVVPLDRLGKVLDDVMRFIAERLLVGRTLVSLRGGRPYLVPFRGELSGTHIDLPFRPRTFTRLSDTEGWEWDLFLPTEDSWQRPQRFGTSQSDYVRFLNRQHDIVVDLNLVSEPGKHFGSTLEETRLYTVQCWEKSIFVLISESEYEKIGSLGIPEPHMVIDWYEGMVLACWLYQEFQSHMVGFRPVVIEAQDDELSESSTDAQLAIDPFEALRTRADRAFEQIRQILATNSIEFLSPRAARHAVALKTESDPFPETSTVCFRSVDILRDGQYIPCPLDFRGRRFTFTKVFQVIGASRSEVEARLSDQCESGVSVFPSNYQVEIFTADYIEGSQVIIVDIYGTGPEELVSTDKLLNLMMEELIPGLGRFHADLESKFGTTKSCTEAYWLMQVGITF